MILSPESLAVVGGALTILVGSAVAFAHRYSDKCSKFDEKSQSDDLNEVRMAIRSETTIAAIDRLWRFLLEAHQKMEKEKQTMDVNLLLYDLYRREPFNKLINDIEETYKESVNVKEAWIALRSNYGRLGKMLYVYAAMFGFIGFPLLGLSSQSVTILSTQNLFLLWAGFMVLGILFLIPIAYAYMKASSNMGIYQEKRRQYLIDEVKLK